MVAATLGILVAVFAFRRACSAASAILRVPPGRRAHRFGVLKNYTNLLEAKRLISNVLHPLGPLFVDRDDVVCEEENDLLDGL